MESNLKRKLTFWLCGFSLAAILLICYFHAPIFPVVLAGVLTLAITFFWYSRKK